MQIFSFIVTVAASIDDNYIVSIAKFTHVHSGVIVEISF